VFEVFLYLLENYTAISNCPDAPTLARRLANEGFDEFEVRSAVLWVEQLRRPLVITHLHDVSETSQRIYHDTERTQLGNDNIALLAQLEANQSITAVQREYIIERAMMLPHMIHRADVFKALLLTILWAHEHDIDDVLLHALIDEIGDETLH
jgi:Smg protein